MKYPHLFHDDDLVPLSGELSPPQLARVCILLRELAFVMANDIDVANKVLNCAGAQIAEHLSDAATEDFRSCLFEEAEDDRTIAVDAPE